MLLAITDTNDCDFGIKFADESQLEFVKKLASIGLATWYQAAHEDKANEYFTEEEVEAFFESGYAEPTSELLDRYGIKHEIIDIEVDEDYNIINCDEVLYL